MSNEYIFLRKLQDNNIRIFVDVENYLKVYTENNIKHESNKFLGTLIGIKIFENYKNFQIFDKDENLKCEYFDYQLMDIDSFKADVVTAIFLFSNKKAEDYFSAIDTEKEFIQIFLYECKDKLIEILEKKGI